MISRRSLEFATAALIGIFGAAIHVPAAAGVAGSIGWATLIPAGTFASLPAVQVTSAEFRILVWYQSTATAHLELVEQWPNLSMESDSPDYAVDRVNHLFTGSRYIVLADASGTTATGLENPNVTSSQALLNGADGADPAAADYAGSALLKTGLYAFDTKQVQLLAAQYN